ncbi:putative bifunctional diguanylate cyclase/phosphodiesterase [Loktanella sp. M215]|uniref:putative bifunctional diguanylate cyclase/phosphodiesterase n=1 Tax=Loktanella sp. M215 TaxID=2675431 RepID=UPI001F1678DF|nr:EAL domain-containing protein [Loktanella sp. M215]
MNRIISCLTQEHQLWLVGVAAAICVVGSVLSVRLTNRYKGVSGTLDRVFLVLISLITGATVWSTHFVAMLAYDPGYPHGFEPIATVLSLLIAIFGIAVATATFKYLPVKQPFIAAGTLLGLSISVMHYVGISAYRVPGILTFDMTAVVISIGMSMLFGIATYHRVAYPLTRYCWIGGMIFLVLAICSLHFVGMSAITIILNPTVAAPTAQLSDMVLAGGVIAVVTILLLLGFASFGIEAKLTMDAKNNAIYAANHDGLTGLPNRRKMVEDARVLSRKLERDPGASLAVVFIDLNGFKTINDLHGHHVGDAVICAVAQRLKKAARETEIIARTGGDEFVILLSPIASIENIDKFARRLHAQIIPPIQIGDLNVGVGAAIGISTSLNDSRQFDSLLNMADLAMYRAKNSGLPVCIFNPDMDVENREELQLMSDLRQACSNGEFELVYQLQNDVVSLAPVGFEALLRWNHPIRGLVMPNSFIPAAEKSGLIREIGRWVLVTACHEAASWDLPLTIAVNVAPQQLVEPDFVGHVVAALKQSGLSPERLELEMTEEGIVEDADLTLDVMTKLKSLGVHIAMDDFGTGYSSLSMLQTFPFDKIKIDRSFVQDVHQNKKRAAIVRATLLLGGAFDIPILAEGVETLDELSFLQDVGCTTAQGYHFGRPMPQEEMRKITRPDNSCSSSTLLMEPEIANSINRDPSALSFS